MGYIDLITKVIHLKLFLEMVPSFTGNNNITTRLREG